MYGWLWRKLPGRLGTKLLTAAALLVVVGAVFWFAVFPLMEPAVTLDEVTLSR